MKEPTLCGITSPDNSLPQFYQTLRDKLTFPLGWHSGISDNVEWKKAALKKAKELILWDHCSKPFDMAILAEEMRDTYRCLRVAVTISDESRIPAYLLIPTTSSRPCPAVILYHDHGAKFDIGKEKCIRPFNDAARLLSAEKWVASNFDGSFIGDELAKQGYVVFCGDALGWGERSCTGYRGDSQQALASNLFNLGTSYAALIAQDDYRSAEFVASLPYVDKKRVAAVGFSMGAFRAWQTAALADCVTAGICNCWMATLQGLMQPDNNQLKGQSAFTMTHPGLSRWLDYPDIAGLAVPKPMLFMSGTDDHLFPVSSVKSAFEKIQNIYQAFDAEKRLETHLLSGGHIFNRERLNMAFRWLARQFQLENR